MARMSTKNAPAVAACVLGLLAAVLLIRLGAQDRGGPPHGDISIGSGIPATLFVPGEPDADDFPYAPPDSDRFPLLVIGHGYSGDRQSVGALARSLAKAGYAVVTFDFRGHGDNTKAFQGDLRQDFDEVLDWATTSPYIDPRRIAVLGHSMGAGAALDFATVDSRPVAVVPISGGFVVNDVRMPANVLLLVASGDPDRITDRQRSIARDLEGRTNLRSVEIKGANHLTIVTSDDTVAAIADFLDPVLRPTTPGPRPAKLDDPRRSTALAYLLVAIALIGLLGTFVGRLVAPLRADPSAGALLLLAGALLIAMPLLATGGYNILPIGAGQPVVVHLSLAGAALWATRFYARRAQPARVSRWIGDEPWFPSRSAAGAGLVGALVVFVLLAPLSVVSHRLVPTTERLVLLVVVAALSLVFFAPFEALVRRGGTWTAVGLGVVGRLMLVAAIFIGVGLHALPAVILLVAPLFIVQYVILEVFAGACYAAGRNPAVIAVVESVLVAWIVTTLTPIS